MYAPWGAGGAERHWEKENLQVGGTDGSPLSGLGCRDKARLLIWLA